MTMGSWGSQFPVFLTGYILVYIAMFRTFVSELNRPDHNGREKKITVNIISHTHNNTKISTVCVNYGCYQTCIPPYLFFFKCIKYIYQRLLNVYQKYIQFALLFAIYIKYLISICTHIIILSKTILSKHSRNILTPFMNQLFSVTVTSPCFSALLLAIFH